MTLVTWSYLAYLAISASITVYLGNTLSRNGRPFLVDVFGTERIADIVNRLLLVGFYLTNIAFVMLTMTSGLHIAGIVDALDLLRGKIGVVLLTLGIMHFVNMAVFWEVRRRSCQP